MAFMEFRKTLREMSTMELERAADALMGSDDPDHKQVFAAIRAELKDRMHRKP